MAYDSATDMQTLTGSAAFLQCQNNFIALDSGAMTIAGIKTFSSSPIVPTPTTDMQASTKKYVDDTAVALTGNQTVAGIKTFSSSPIIPAPTTDLQAATKKYADDIATTKAAAVTKATLGIDSGAATTAATLRVNFAFTFSSAPKVVCCAAENTTNYAPNVESIDTTGFTLRNNSGVSHVYNWIAVGAV